MGIIATLTRYPAAAFAQAKAAGSFSPPNQGEMGHCHLDRAWDELHPVFKSLGLPLSLALNGDYGLDGGLTGFGWDESNESDHYLAFVSPPLVAQIAGEFCSLGFDQLAQKLQNLDRAAEHLESRLADLMEFYAAAAYSGDCVFICVA